MHSTTMPVHSASNLLEVQQRHFQHHLHIESEPLAGGSMHAVSWLDFCRWNMYLMQLPVTAFLV